jgi:hypothetical protein
LPTSGRENSSPQNIYNSQPTVGSELDPALNKFPA